MRRKAARDAATAHEMLLQSLRPSSAEAATLGIEAECCHEQFWHKTPPNQLSHPLLWNQFRLPLTQEAKGCASHLWSQKLPILAL